MIPSVAPEAAAAPLPRLRKDIELQVVAERGNGFPSVVVTDSVRGTYFRLSWPQSGAILLWKEADTLEGLAARLKQVYGIGLTAQDLGPVVEFVISNQLSEVDAQGSWQQYSANLSKSRHGWFLTLAHNYLFFRVPLLHPDEQLKRLLPRVSFFFTHKFWLAVALLGMLASYLATRQSSSFMAAARDAWALEGVFIYAVALLGLKAIHEFGHALTTVRYGCSVPSMGAAFMLGAPVLYTDTSDSWRLAKRSERLAIVFAGVAAEIVVAVVALLFWVFLPDGLARTLCFALATGAVAVSLLVNLNPFMRFDGYFGFSDYLQVPNLQARAFALATWRMREALFGFGAAPPEIFAPLKQRVLIGYAFVTWVYRFFLYIGIVAVVYVVAGKAIGILLALFEIVVFIALPVVSEIKVWWALRDQMRQSPRARWTMAAVGCAMVVAFVPWLGSVEVPAVVTAEREEAIHPYVPARLTRLAVAEGSLVKAGDVLFETQSPDLERQINRAALDERQLLIQSGRLHAHDKEREQRGVIESKLSQVQEKLAGLKRQREQLTVRAPFDGRVVDLDPELSTGLWIGPKNQLARVISPRAASVRGLVAESDVDRLKVGASAVFIADDAAHPKRIVKLRSIAQETDGRLPDPALSDRFGGPIPTGDERGEARTRHSWLEVSFISTDELPQMMTRGIVRVAADRVSPAHLLWRQIGRVLVREQAF